MTTPVNVFVRVRPLNEQECKENAENCIETGEKTVKVFLVHSDQFINKSFDFQVIGSSKTFGFDKVFDDSIGQESIAKVVMEPKIDKLFEGNDSSK